MDISHDALVVFAKTFGLFDLIAMFVGVAIYAFWPSLGTRRRPARRRRSKPPPRRWRRTW